MKKILKWTGIVLGVLTGLTLLTVLALYPSGMKKFNQSFPGIRVEAVKIPTDSEAIARGKHIATIWGCAKCHGEDFSGMLLANDPFLGTIPASNLTSGNGGVGKSYTDTDWIRAIRHGVMPDNQVEVFMYEYFSTMSDQDLGDLIAYLKQIPPVDTDYPELHVGPVLVAAPAVGLFTPAAELIDHSAPRPPDPTPGETVEYGRYLSTVCTECHGNRLAGKVANWEQEDFVRAIQTGVLPNGKQINAAMSLKIFGEMNNVELAAMWLYLQSLAPVASQK